MERVTRKIVEYLEDMEKKAKQMSFTKNLKKEVETGKNGTQKYVIKQGVNKGKTCMIEVVVALLMIVNGEIKEHRIQESMSTCLKAKRVAMRSGTSRIDYQCIKSKAETEIYMGEKSIVKLILK